ncbi:hypothetical protein [Halobacteriaceae bacterium SHR40]|uniref:helix-turn-helix transcriptional regulator n=1 Tax=Halovenus amylolytica TaxID=2500550 RepID=UPI000FE38D76
MTSSLETVEFLARSENRVRALATLATRPCDRNELADVVGVSRVTAQRILDDFVQYGWATETDRTYRATDLGSIVSEAFETLLDTVDATQRLAAVTPWLPSEFDVDMRSLTDARITLPTHSDPLAPVRRSTELMGEAASVRGVGAGIAPDALRVNHDSVVDGGQSFEVVFSGDVLDVIAADPRMSGWMREMLTAGASVYRHEEIGLLLGEFDGEVVGFGVGDESGIPRGFVESKAEEVLKWFEETFEHHRLEAELVTADEFTS